MNTVKTMQKGDKPQIRSGIARGALSIGWFASCLLWMGAVGCLAETPPPPSEPSPQELALLEQYTRLRLDGTAFANAIAGYWFLESQQSGRYFIFSVWDGPDVRTETTCISRKGEEIRTVWFPVPPDASQSPIDMCRAYNGDMLGFALDLARDGDSETALRICRQIRKVSPDMEEYYPWNELEKDLMSGDSDLRYPWTRKNTLPPALSRCFFDFRKMLEGQ